MFRHPNYYKKLRASHVKKAISPDESTDSDGRAPTVESYKRQASSHKLQATSNKLQASGEAASSKR
jgi:hypothetical protein